MRDADAKYQPRDTPPAYARLLEEVFGADAIEENRAYVQSAPQLGEPRHALAVGARAPLFALHDETGALVTLSGLLAHGPVVVVFYRGGWCPFCNVYLRALQLARSHMRALGAQVVLVSPQRREHAQPLIERHSLLFPLLSDVGNQVARQYGLVFRMPDVWRDEYLADGTDLAEVNGDPSWEVPMPATFVVDRHGVIKYAFVSADYTQRAEIADLLAVLRSLTARRS
jgi:peroxiredoxin